MKIFRSLPFIAAAILGLIFFGLFKTSDFVNKKVAVEKITSMDSLTTIVSNAIDSTQLVSPAISSTTASNMPTDTTKIQGAKATNDLGIVELTSSSTDVVAPTLPPVSNVSGESPAMSEKTNATAISNDTKPKKRANVTTPKVPNNSQTVHNTEKEVAVRSKGVSEGRYHVVIGSYGVKANAKADAAAFEKKNKTKTKVVIHKGLYRVSSQDFDSQKAATDYAAKLKSGGEQTMILNF